MPGRADIDPRAGKAAEALLGQHLAPRARAVVDALLDARKSAVGFLLSCGLLPEVSESCSESLHDHVHALSTRHLERERLLGELRRTLQKRGADAAALEDIDHALTSLLAADATAAYVFGLAAGMALGSLDRRLSE